MAKFIEHQCIVWNEAGWRKPAGPKHSAHPGKIGWGHEEWNNSRGRVVEGWRAFHTQGSGASIRQIAQERLAIIITAYHPVERAHYLVGVACDVLFANDDDAFKKKLNLYGSWRDAWESADIRRRYNHIRSKFLRRWDHEYDSVAWKCRERLYWWAEVPIKLPPASLRPYSRRRLTWRYSTSQPIRWSKDLIGLLRRASCKKSVLAWFEDRPDNFTVRNGSGAVGATARTRSSGSNRPTDQTYIRYIQKRELIISAAHKKLQSRFVRWLRKRGFGEIEENQRYVDVFCRHRAHGEFLIEVKPCRDANEARYAVRQGLGQLFEYRQSNLDRCSNPRLLIVLGAKPRSETLSLLQWAEVGVAWLDGGAFTWRPIIR